MHRCHHSKTKQKLQTLKTCTYTYIPRDTSMSSLQKQKQNTNQ